jgi:glycosyltransferase involved in cell wall biosynthesis
LLGVSWLRVVIINDFSVARGGATTLVQLLARLLRDRGIPVTMLVGDEGKNAELEALDIDIVKLGRTRLLDRGAVSAAVEGIWNPSASSLVDQWIEANDTPQTVYHVNVFSQILSPSIFKVLRRVARRTVIHAHDFFHACPNGAFMDYRKNETCHRTPLGLSCLTTNCDRRSYPQKLWRVGRQVALNYAMGSDVPWARLILLHEKMAPFFNLAGYRNETMAVVRNPVYPFTRDRIQSERNDRFFFIGRLEEEKGPQDFLEAAKLAGVGAEIIGDGPLRPALETAYPDATFHGWREREAIGGIISNARALVIPSRYPEPFGLVAAEASSSGLPVILTSQALLAQEIVENQLGAACNTRDVAAFVAVLKSFADMPGDQALAISQRAFSGVTKIANTEQEWVDEILSILAGLLGKRPLDNVQGMSPGQGLSAGRGGP